VGIQRPDGQLPEGVRGANNLQVSYTLSKQILDGVDFFNTVRGTQRTPQEKGHHVLDTTHSAFLLDMPRSRGVGSVHSPTAIATRQRTPGRLRSGFVEERTSASLAEASA
jgi:hypothetical protein